MLRTKLLHPEILAALGSNGHGARILIADGNYPFTTCTPASARKVFLNFSHDLLSVIDVLSVLVDYIAVESALVMLPPEEIVPEIHQEFVGILGKETPLAKVKRFDFYEVAKSADTCLVIATGESRRFANILLTIGVVK
jgi:L-fucose mutarotase